LLALRTGVDLVDIERFVSVCERYKERMLNRLFTPIELAENSRNMASLAARFAAKEAVVKALGTGIGPVCWQDIEISRGPSGEPILHLYGSAQRLADELDLSHWSLSLSHTHDQAIALVVALGG
jgi:holo-[acyl-carrier protein] synthase